MVRLFVKHRVANYSTWRQGYDAFDAQRPAFGVIRAAVFQDASDPELITVTHDFDTLEEAQAMAASEPLKEAMVSAGVVGVPEVWFARPV